MTIRTTTIAATALAGGVLLALGAPLAASAHVGVTPSSTAAGSSTVLTFAFGHGFAESPTTKPTFDIPESIYERLADPQPQLHDREGRRARGIAPLRSSTPRSPPSRTAIATRSSSRCAFPRMPRARPSVSPRAPDVRRGRERLERGRSKRRGRAREPSADDRRHRGDRRRARNRRHRFPMRTPSRHRMSQRRPPTTRWRGSSGIGGLVVGVVGVVLALAARRRRTDG